MVTVFSLAYLCITVEVVAIELITTARHQKLASQIRPTNITGGFMQYMSTGLTLRARVVVYTTAGWINIGPNNNKGYDEGDSEGFDAYQVIRRSK